MKRPLTALVLGLPLAGEFVPLAIADFKPPPLSGPVLVANNAALKALSGGANTPVERLGYTSAGDGGLMLYAYSGSACPLNSGSGDDGSQVRSSDGKCWLWQPVGLIVTPQVFGCKGDGGTDDTACLQAAINARQGGSAGSKLVIDQRLYRITSGLMITQSMQIVGTQLGTGQGTWRSNTPCAAGIRVDAANIIAITIAAAATVMDGVCIDNANVNNNSGATIGVGAVDNVTIRNSQINGGCISIDISGSGNTQNVGSLIDHNTFIPVNNAGCVVLRVGHNSVNGSTTDLQVTRNETLGASNVVCMQIEDAGGLFVSHTGFVACRYGTYINPGSDQYVDGCFFTGTVLGDSSANGDLLIDTAASSAIVGQIQITGSWMASATGPSVTIQNTGGGYIGGVHFAGDLIYPRVNQNGVNIIGGNDITIDDSTICAPTNSSGTMLQITTGGSTAVRNSTIGACDRTAAGPGNAVNTGIIYMPSAAGIVQILGNTFFQTATPLIYNPAGSSTATIANNVGIDDITGATVASDTTITAPVNPIFSISGTAVITTMKAGWTGRQMTINPVGAFSFATGGNIGNSLKATAGVPIFANFDGAYWHVK